MKVEATILDKTTDDTRIVDATVAERLSDDGFVYACDCGEGGSSACGERFYHINYEATAYPDSPKNRHHMMRMIDAAIIETQKLVQV